MRVEPGPPPSPREVRESQRLAALADSALSRARDTSERWRNGLALATGAVVAAGLLQGRETAVGLSGDWRIVTGIAVLVAAAAAVTAIGAAMLASFGWPSLATLGDVGDLERWEHEEAERTLRRLRASMAATLVAIIALLAAVGAAWFAPTSEPRLELQGPGGVACADGVRVTSGGATTSGGARVAPGTSVAARDDCE